MKPDQCCLLKLCFCVNSQNVNLFPCRNTRSSPCPTSPRALEPKEEAAPSCWCISPPGPAVSIPSLGWELSGAAVHLCAPHPLLGADRRICSHPPPAHHAHLLLRLLFVSSHLLTATLQAAQENACSFQMEWGEEQ